MTKRLLTSQDIFNFQMVDDPQVSPDGSTVAWVKTRIDPQSNNYKSAICVTDIASARTFVISPGTGETHPRWSPDGKTLVYLAPNQTPREVLEPEPAVDFLGRGKQLFAATVPDAWTDGALPARQLTNLPGGVMNPRYSPKGSHIAFVTMVHPEEGLQEEGLQGDMDTSSDDLYTRFNRDVLCVSRTRWKSDAIGFIGDYRRQVACLDMSSNNVHLVTLGTFEVSPPSWSPDGTKLAVATNPNPNNDMERQQFVFVLDAVPAEPYGVDALAPIAGLQEMRSSDIAWLDGSTLIIGGHDDSSKGHYGLQRLWRVSLDGDKTCLTEHLDISFGDYSRNYDMRRYAGDDGVRIIDGGKTLLVLANAQGTVHLNRFDIASGTLTPLTEGDSVTPAFSIVDDTLVVLTGDSLNPGNLFQVNVSALQSPRKLTTVNDDFLATIQLSPAQKFQATSDGVTVDGWVNMPPEGDNPPAYNPPVILYTGGGPGGMRASVFCLEFQVYAARGYAVINCNARGNYGYGEPFSLATKGNWGDLDGDDNMAYLRDVCEHFPVDNTRTAVAGGSYGGYMATWLMCRHPDAFNAAVVDRSLMSRFVGTSDFGYLLEKVEFDGKFAWDDLERYLHRSPITHIGSAKTPTLVVHSALDHRCPVNQGEQLYAALTYLGVPTELVRFPNETHDLSRAGRPWHRVFRMDKYLEWFAKYLRM